MTLPGFAFGMKASCIAVMVMTVVGIASPRMTSSSSEAVDPHSTATTKKSDVLRRENSSNASMPEQVRQTVGTFRQYDLDGDGRIAKNESSKLLKDLGLADTAWNDFDPHHKGTITEVDFRRLKEDSALFVFSDKDHSGFLEQNEIESLLQRAHLTDKQFNWLLFDHDGDHRLSKSEFLGAGPAAASAALQHRVLSKKAASLLQEDDVSPIDEPVETSALHMKVSSTSAAVPPSAAGSVPAQPAVGSFSRYDSNRDGKLQKAEAAKLLKDLGMRASAWSELDPQQKGMLTEVDFNRIMKDHALFHREDQNHSGYLEQSEIASLLALVHLSEKVFNWHAFDHDGDHRLSEPEFIGSGPAAANAVHQHLIKQDGSASLLEQGA